MDKQTTAQRCHHRATLDRQPEDAISEAGVAVCRLTLVAPRAGGRASCPGRRCM